MAQSKKQHPKPKAQTLTLPENFTFDDLYNQVLVLEACTRGLCHLHSQFEGECFNDIELATFVQMNTVKQMLRKMS